MLFQDRFDVRRLLASRLRSFANRSDTVVLALPRGGVPVGFEVAMALNAPLDVFVVRKLGVPGHEELVMGAIASGGICVLNEDLVRAAAIANEIIKAVAAGEERELERREHLYREGGPAVAVRIGSRSDRLLGYPGAISVSW
jgi:predicted phosphoribosyltransferase